MLGILCKEALKEGDKVITSLSNLSIQENSRKYHRDSYWYCPLPCFNHIPTPCSKVPHSKLWSNWTFVLSWGYWNLCPTGSKQVEVVGKDEKRTFTLMVGISMSGEVLPFQAVYAGKTKASLPTSSAPNYTKETEELKIHIESSGNNTYWSTMRTTKNYVINILVSYFELYLKLDLPNQLCIWQIGSFVAGMHQTYP
jgi:hypothetical protein